MSSKPDPEHVPDLALEPVRCWPKRDEGIHLGGGLFNGNHEPQPMLVGHGIEVVHDREAFVRWAGPRVFIRNLRKKVEVNPEQPEYITTEPWVGYRFNGLPESS